MVASPNEIFDVEIAAWFGRQHFGGGLAEYAVDFAMAMLQDIFDRTLLRQLRRDFLPVKAQLLHQIQLVADKPLFDDAIIFDKAIGNRAPDHLAAGGRAVSALAGVGTLTCNAVGGVIAVLIVPGPDDIVGVQLPIRERG